MTNSLIRDPILYSVLLLTLILSAPLLFQRLKLPGLLGLILAGTLVGPGGLGFLERDRTIVLMGNVGLTYLMFVAGLSLDLQGFLRMRARCVGFGAASFFIPQALALIVGTQWLGYSLTTSLLLGSIVGSHTLLAYPIAHRLKITKNPAVTVAAGGTLMTDILSLGVLAIVVGTTAENTGVVYWLTFVLGISAFVIGAYYILPNLGRWFFKNARSDRNNDFIFLLLLVFTSAYLAELAGLAPIIGAFVAGLLLNRLVPESSTLMNRIQFVGNSLLIPIFLISVGMLVDVKQLVHWELWLTALIFTALVVMGKGGSALLMAKLFGYSKAEGLVLAGLTIPQAAATLAVTLIGYELQLFDQGAVNAVVIMILITCLIGPWLVEAQGREVALSEKNKPYNPLDTPQRILIPLANPKTADHLLDISIMLHESNSLEPLFPLIVAADDENVEANVARSEKMLEAAVAHLASAALPVIPLTKVDLNIAKGISRAIQESRITTVVIGWNGQVTAKGAIFGTILDQLLQESKGSLVLVCKVETRTNLFDRLIVAVPPYASREPGFADALHAIKTMAVQMGVECLILHAHDGDIIDGKLDSIAPKLDLKYHDLESWRDLVGWLEENRKTLDLFVLLSAQEGALSWRASLRSLPRVLARQFNDLCFVVAYPAEREFEASKARSLRL